MRSRHANQPAVGAPQCQPLAPACRARGALDPRWQRPTLISGIVNPVAHFEVGDSLSDSTSKRSRPAATAGSAAANASAAALLGAEMAIVANV
jgi:hypothetical protein